MIIGSHNSWSYLPPKHWWMRPFAFMARCQSCDIQAQYEKYGDGYAKSIVADDCFTCIGTVNLDNRSFYLNEEDTVFFYDETIAREALADFLDVLERSQEVSAGDGRITGLRKTWINFLLSIAPIL